jgi:hypothetical protein
VAQNNWMTRLLFTSLFLLSIWSFGLAQQGGTGSGGDLLKELQEDRSGEQVSIEADSLLEVNYYKLLTRNKKSSGIPGYRIRIYSESGTRAKEGQQRIKASFLSSFPETDAYIRYDEPFFKVYVGDCRTKSEALKLFDQIKKEFPNPIIVPGYINLKSADK